MIINLDNIEVSDEGQFKEEIESRLDLELFLNRLPPRKREVFSLRSEGYKYREIELKMKISSKTISKYSKEVGKQMRANMLI